MLIRESTRRITRRGPGRLSRYLFTIFSLPRPPTDSLIRRLTLRSTDIAFVKELMANITQRLALVNAKKNLRPCLY